MKRNREDIDERRIQKKLHYLAKRLLLFIPTFIFISAITFFISINAPGDAVEALIGQDNSAKNTSEGHTQAYSNLQHKLGLDLPLFYFSLSSYVLPDTFYKIRKSDQKNALECLAYRYGNWQNASNYYLSIKTTEQELLSNTAISTTEKNNLKIWIAKLLTLAEEKNIKDHLLFGNTAMAEARFLTGINNALEKLILEKKIYIH